jgi:7,8-dihydroneopterin 2',3'-cyclic phosphate phosphodiesterase
MKEKLIELAKKIKDRELREKVIDIIENPKLSNEEILYEAESIEEIPSSTNAHHSHEGGNIEHTISVTELAIKIAEHVEKTYGVKINYDYLIAGALLHDLMKIYQLKRDSSGKFVHSGCLIDHAVLCACELYARGFPEEVIHIVEAHGGDLGQAAARPQTIEALIVFYADVLDAAIESFIRPKENLAMLLL